MMNTGRRKTRAESVGEISNSPELQTCKSSGEVKLKKASHVPARNPKKKQGNQSSKPASAPLEKRALKLNKTAITTCVQQELRRYFDMLDGEEPANVYHLVMRQAEFALIDSVMQECGGNQSKATKWLGISRGNLRNKLAEMGYD